MKAYNRKTDGKLPKGQMCMDAAGWVCVIMEAERTKNYKEHNIINCVDVFGFYHECGSKYANEIQWLLNEEEYRSQKAVLGFGNEDTYYKGKLIGY